MTKQEQVSKYLRTLALHIDPMNGRLSSLAKRMDTHPSTVHKWIAHGEIPPKPLRRLENLFGDVARLDDET